VPHIKLATYCGFSQWFRTSVYGWQVGLRIELDLRVRDRVRIRVGAIARVRARDSIRARVRFEFRTYGCDDSRSEFHHRDTVLNFFSRQGRIVCMHQCIIC